VRMMEEQFPRLDESYYVLATSMTLTAPHPDEALPIFSSPCG